MATTAEDIRYRGVYCYELDGKIMYVGSAYCRLTILEDNHRNAMDKEDKYGKPYYMSTFRKALDGPHRDRGTFKWLVKPYRCNQKEIEKREGELIREHDTPYNDDRYPMETSIRRGRYK